MNLKEKLKAKMAELAGLKAKIEDGDAEAIKAGAAIADEIEELEERIKNAEKAQAKLKSLGGDDGFSGDDDGDVRAKSLGEHFVKSAGIGEVAKGSRFALSASPFKAAGDPTTIATPSSIADAITTFDTNIVQAARTKLVIRDLFGSETISGNALTFFVEGAQNGSIGEISEGAKKSQIDFADPTPVTVALTKLAGFIKETDELISDAPFLESTINGRLLYALGLKEQNWLVAKLTGTSGIQTGTYGKTDAADAIADLILQAAADVEEAGGYAADAVVINPALYTKLRLGKNANKDYYGGGYFGEQSIPSIWGMPAVVTSAVNGIIVGAFKASASVVSKGGISVEATNSNEDDFVKNIMTIRAEERLALAVRRPAGFKVLTQATETQTGK